MPSIADVEQLYELLESRNLAALDKFGMPSVSLMSALDAATSDRLREAMDDLDFLRGAKILRKALLGREMPVAQP